MRRALEGRLIRLKEKIGSGLARVAVIYSRTSDEAAGEFERLRALGDVASGDVVIKLTGCDGPTRSHVDGVDMQAVLRTVDGNTRGVPRVA